MSTSTIYQKIRLSKSLHGTLYQARKASNRHCADTLENWRSGQRAGLHSIVDVAARGTMASVLGAPDGNVHAPVTSAWWTHTLAFFAARSRGWAPAVFHSPYASVPILGPVAPLAIALAPFVVGSGAFDHEIRNLPRVHNRAQSLHRYGILGLPEAAFVQAAENFSLRKQPTAATACRVGAIVCALPLEVARVAVWLATVVSALPLMLVLVAFHVAYAVARHLWDSSADPKSYLCHMQAANGFWEQEYREQRMRDEFDLLSTDLRLIDQRAQTLTDKVQRSLHMVSAVVQANSAEQARDELLRVCAKPRTTGGAPAALDEKIELLQETYEHLSALQRRREGGLSMTSDAVLLDHLLRWQDQNESCNLNVWETKMFHKASLRLHPDKLNYGTLPLPSDSRQWATAAYNLIVVLRDLHQTMPATGTWPLASASDALASSSSANLPRAILPAVSSEKAFAQD